MWTKLYGMITLIITYLASAYSLVKRSKEITYQEKFKAVLEPSERKWTPVEQQYWKEYVISNSACGRQFKKNPAYKSSNGF